MRVAVEGKAGQVEKSLFGPPGRNCPGPFIAAHYLGNFNVDQMRCVQGFTGSKDSLRNARGGGSLE